MEIIKRTISQTMTNIKQNISKKEAITTAYLIGSYMLVFILIGINQTVFKINWMPMQVIKVMLYIGSIAIAIQGWRMLIVFEAIRPWRWSKQSDPLQGSYEDELVLRKLQTSRKTSTYTGSPN